MNIEAKIKSLITHRILGVETPEETVLIEQWRQESDTNEQFYRTIVDHERLAQDMELYQSLNWEVAYQKTVNAGAKRLLDFRLVTQWAAIFILVALTSISVYLFMDLETHQSTLTQHFEQPGKKARLIKSDGSIVELSGDKSFTFSEAVGVNVKSAQGEVVVYSDENAKPQKDLNIAIYNTLEVPRGGEYKLILGDGTQIWLNAGSVLKYPVTFDGIARPVYLTGEAYFDVAKGKEPFIVHTQGGAVEVLGTQFNVKAYQEEHTEYITLEEGSVRVSNHEGEFKDIQPGYQVQNLKPQSSLNARVVNTSYYTGWRDGVFRFDGETLEGVMSVLARWYDFKYHFDKAELSELHFTGTLKRYESAQKVFSMIEQTSNVKIVIANEQIIIK